MKVKFLLIAGSLLLLAVPLTVVLSGEPPRSVFPETRFSFGKVMKGTTVEHEFVLRNEGGSALRILGINATAPLELRRLPAQIEPNAEVRLKAQLDTSRLSGPFEGRILIALNDPALPEARLVFEGRVIPPVELSPRSAFFVAGRRGEHRQASIEIINHGPDSLRIESVEHPSGRFTTKLETIEMGKRYRLSLILNPDGPGGKKAETILVKTSSRLMPQLKIPVNTNLHERVYTFPEVVDLGSLRLADIRAKPDLLHRLAQTLMIYQWGGSDFWVNLRTDLPMLDLKLDRGPKGDRFQVTITHLKDKIIPGPVTGNIFIETNDSQFPSLTVPVTGAILEE